MSPPKLPKIDPDLDLIVRSIHTLAPDIKELSALSGVSRSTIRNWRKRKTKRPQHITLKAVALALGWKMTLTPKGK